MLLIPPSPLPCCRGHASEKPELPDALDETPTGIRFLGPPSTAMAALGDKIGSTILAQAAGVPTIPWSGDGVAIRYEGGWVVGWVSGWVAVLAGLLCSLLAALPLSNCHTVSAHQTCLQVCLSTPTHPLRLRLSTCPHAPALSLPCHCRLQTARVA